PRAVDAPRIVLAGAVVDGGIGAAAEKKAVLEDVISADDLARVVDAEGLGAIVRIGIVEGGVGIDGHDVASLYVSRQRRPASPILSCMARRTPSVRATQSQRPVGHVSRG